MDILKHMNRLISQMYAHDILISELNYIFLDIPHYSFIIYLCCGMSKDLLSWQSIKLQETLLDEVLYL